MTSIFRDLCSIGLLLIIVSIELNFISGNTLIDSTSCNKTDNEEQRVNVTDTLNGSSFISSDTQQHVQSSTTTVNPITTITLKPSNTTENTSTTEQSNLCKCGIASSASGKIVGGTPVNEQNFWPWFAALVRADRVTKVHCGASLISRRYVLTAAHCLYPMIQVGLRNFIVKLGYNELWEDQTNITETSKNDNKNDRFVVPIESVTLHPKYEKSFPYHYDIGVVKLSYPINCTNRVRPICLPTTDLEEKGFTNEMAITTGFGRTSIDGNHSRILQQIQLKLIPMSQCTYNFSKLPFKPPELLDSMVCAWNKKVDSCVGDSGGPLFLWSKANNVTSEISSYFEQIGITSWGIGCANDKFPGVYTKVSKFLPWLKSIVGYDLT